MRSSFPHRAGAVPAHDANAQARFTLRHHAARPDFSGLSVGRYQPPALKAAWAAGMSDEALSHESHCKRGGRLRTRQAGSWRSAPTRRHADSRGSARDPRPSLPSGGTREYPARRGIPDLSRCRRDSCCARRLKPGAWEQFRLCMDPGTPCHLASSALSMRATSARRTR
jgi:hypothetical protein